ncbi:hypothetical protein Taro_024272 [Colocasia esculenta]|uniref:Uncharacterized protein n=1 Tax=Colocasia esculenta TaxID=4460 RepID=A0A843VJV9_COLES|nr:hypothetical protein [Colocasia esculenta]
MLTLARMRQPEAHLPGDAESPGHVLVRHQTGDLAPASPGSQLVRLPDQLLQVARHRLLDCRGEVADVGRGSSKQNSSLSSVERGFRRRSFANRRGEMRRQADIVMKEGLEKEEEKPESTGEGREKTGIHRRKEDTSARAGPSTGVSTDRGAANISEDIRPNPDRTNNA